MGLQIATGTFQKSTAAAPASQTITGLPFQPKALILYTTNNTNLNTWSNPGAIGIGFSSAAGSSYAAAAVSDHGITPSNTSTRIAGAALTILAGGESLLAECSLTSFNADGFTLNWTTNDGNAYRIAYIALGGNHITNTAAGATALPAAAGPTTVSGLGFSPDLLITLTTRITAAIPTSQAEANLTLAITTRPCISASASWMAADNGTSTTQAACLGNWAAATLNGLAGSPYTRTLLSSFDADGFTLYSPASPAAHRLIYLAIKGGSYALATIAKPATTPNTTLRTTPPFVPRGILALSSHKSDPTFNTAPARFALGACDGTNATSASLTATYASGATKTYAIITDAALLSLANNDTGTETTKIANPTLANPTTLTLNPNDTNPAAIALLYLGDDRAPVASDQSLTFPMWDFATGKTPTAGLTITAERSTDGGAFTACDNAVTEISDGFYRLELTEADRTGTAILFKFTASGALTQSIQLLNRP